MFTVYRFAGDLQLVTNPEGFRQLYRGTTRIRTLGPKDLQVLEVLLTPAQEIHTRSEIFDKVWGNLDRGEEVITTAIANIRSNAFKEQTRGLIETIQGRMHLKREGGYRYNGSVEIFKSDTLPGKPRVDKTFSGIDLSMPIPTALREPIPVSLTDTLENHNSDSTLKISPVPESGANNDPDIEESKQSSRRYPLFAVSAAVLMLAVVVWYAQAGSHELSVQIQSQPIVRQSQEIRVPMVTDGTQLYFSECLGPRFRLGRVNIQAIETESTPFETTVKNPDLSDISPDGSYLLVRDIPRFINDNGLFYSQPTDGRPAIPLGGIRGFDGTWSSDGKWIYYSTDDKIYVAYADGSNPQLFVDRLPGTAFWLRWSPDGKVLRFSLIQEHIYSLWEVTLADRLPRRLQLDADNGSSRCCGNWNSTGDVYFYQTKVNGAYQIWARQESSGHLMPFVGQLVDNTGPTPARAGNIVFAKSETRRAELEQFDRTTQTPIAVLPAESIGMAAMSPDGQRIVYSTFPNRSLYVSRRDGTDKKTLTGPSVEPAVPTWSPDGSWIAYMTRMNGSWQVYIVSAEGGQARPLLDDSRNPVRDPSWSPDGKQILIGYGPLATGKPETMALYIVDVASRKLGKPIAKSDGLFSPRWSPDGRNIAALSADGSRLFLYSHDSGWRLVIENAKLGYPNWSHDSQTLYVEDTTESGNVIKRIHVSDFKVEIYADLAPYRQPCSIFGSWVGIDGDSPLFIKDVSTRLVGVFKYRTR